ncbi:PTS fructose transporter subunit IIABC [Acidipropionibacterium virtanenii]|uniref:PTS system fructose-specific EIIABC component n=1 Tax=Acidipropionibacterium virtanenii TaxID=2057246 RepID=A0A344UXI0_9ACTN|nr:fructose-specific PTS transporter subunit EIIC [Acidipropionibacterium virtanenii]AXE39978.1 PTS system fructose-specific EIIABC component [Acidipropionibacterium virtanenii]
MSDSLIDPQIVVLDVDLGSTKQDVIRSLAGVVGESGRADGEGLARDAMAREELAPTGMPGGFAIPHCRSEAVNQPSLGFARLNPKVDFGGPDGPADLVFMICGAEGAGEDHMKLLTKLARALVKADYVEQLRQAPDADAVVSLIRGVIEPSEAPASAPAPAPASAPEPADAGDLVHVVAVTACPTGIAHTYMAADYLTDAGKEMGVDVKVEPQGSTGVEPLDDADIAKADAVIFATDVGVRNKARFAGKPVIESGVKRAVNEPKKMIEEAVAAAKNPHAHRVAADDGGAEEGGDDKSQLSWGKRIQQALMTGVSYMIPFVAAGGLLIALSFLVAGFQVSFISEYVMGNFSITHLPSFADLQAATRLADAPFTLAQISSLNHAGFLIFLGSALNVIGNLAFSFLVPALAGYIGFALADRPGIAPGFVAGAIAVFMSAGFLGGLIGGLIAGLIAMWIASWTVPKWLRGLMPVVIIPLLTSLITGLLMLFVLGRPIALLMKAMTNGLANMPASLTVVLGIILGLMMCADLGGPINKTAYLFATAGLSVTDEASMKVMAAVMAAGMVPPLAMALSTVLRPKLYTKAEQENGTAAWLLGASFISEGAIPFGAADPGRVLPSMMVGGAVTGAISMGLGAASKAPHGGIFVFFAIDRFWAFALAIIAGAVVSGLLVTFLKSRGAAKKESTKEVTASAAA